MMRRLVIALALSAFVACEASSYTVLDGSALETTEAKLILQEMDDSALDPQAVQFRNLRYGVSGETICGEVNMKNAFGGYVGFRSFYVALRSGGVSMNLKPQTRYAVCGW